MTKREELAFSFCFSFIASDTNNLLVSHNERLLYSIPNITSPPFLKEREERIQGRKKGTKLKSHASLAENAKRQMISEKNMNESTDFNDTGKIESLMT